MDNINNICDTKDLFSKFHTQVSDLLIRHKSILDVMTKLDEYNARINRAVAKSVTTCGCISIHAKKQNYDGESYEEISKNVSNHLHGLLCENCKDVLEEEIGSHLFYLVSLCNTLDLDLHDIMVKEYERNELLGIYSLK